MIKRWLKRSSLLLLFLSIVGLSACTDINKVLNVEVESKQNESTTEFQKEQKLKANFVRHIDGDTSVFRLEGKEIKVRYLLIDTPETVKPNTPIQPYGKEASNRTKEILTTASKIELEFDKGDEKDDYNRYLAYVYADGEMVQDILAREGFARVAYVYEPSITYLKQLEISQKQAKDSKLNIWSVDGYVTDKGFEN
ncbi:MAG TPA: thermonuclease family protein [Lactovum miscens]